MKKPQCDMKTAIGCNGQIVRRVTGTKKGDPAFNCCIGCRAILSRWGIKVKDAPTKLTKARQD